MNVSLTRELENWVQDKVRSGRYHSASEVIREALRLLEEHESIKQARLKGLKKEISAGIRQLDRNETVPFDKKLLAGVKRRGRGRLKSSST